VDLLFLILVPIMRIQATIRLLAALICILELKLVQEVQKTTPSVMSSLRIGTPLDMIRGKTGAFYIRKVSPTPLHLVIGDFVGILIVIGMYSLTDASTNTGSGAVMNICGLR